MNSKKLFNPETLFLDELKIPLEATLPGYMAQRRWFGGKARTIQAVKLVEAVALTESACLALLQVIYTEGRPEIYLLPLAWADAEQAANLANQHPAAVIVEFETGLLYDAVWSNRFNEALLEAITQQQHLQGVNGMLIASATAVLASLHGSEPLKPTLLGVEQSNTSIRYGDRLILKLFRSPELGLNPDLEIGYFLTEKAAYPNIPPVAGALEYRPAQPLPPEDSNEPLTLAILQGFVPNQGDAWHVTLAYLADYFERVALAGAPPPADFPADQFLELAQRDFPPLAWQIMGGYLELAQLLGQRTAELHLALASNSSDPHFAPEPFPADYPQTLYQSMCALTGQTFGFLRQRLGSLPPAIRPKAEHALSLESEIFKQFQTILSLPLTARRIRCHGDYHLGQVLYTGQDFMLIDFEGEPARSLAERRQKRSPLQDVAGMLRSFHYAAYAAFFVQAAAQPAQRAALESWANFWYGWASAAFLQRYLQLTAHASFQPQAPEELQSLLDIFLLEKAVYELAYELNNRPDWVQIPLQGVLQPLSLPD